MDTGAFQFSPSPEGYTRRFRGCDQDHDTQKRGAFKVNTPPFQNWCVCVSGVLDHLSNVPKKREIVSGVPEEGFPERV